MSHLTLLAEHLARLYSCTDQEASAAVFRIALQKSQSHPPQSGETAQAPEHSAKQPAPARVQCQAQPPAKSDQPTPSDRLPPELAADLETAESVLVLEIWLAGRWWQRDRLTCVHALQRRRGCQDNLAEECVAEAERRALSFVRRHGPQRFQTDQTDQSKLIAGYSRLRGWLYQVADRVFIDIQRRANKSVQLEALPDLADRASRHDPADGSEMDLTILVNQWLEQRPEFVRRLMLLRHPPVGRTATDAAIAVQLRDEGWQEVSAGTQGAIAQRVRRQRLAAERHFSQHLQQAGYPPYPDFVRLHHYR